MKPLISGEKSYFEEPLIGGGIAGIGPRITYGGNTYLLAGNTLFQADEDGDNYHVIKAYKMHISGCEYPVTGWEGVPSEFATLDYSEMLSFYQDGNILILAKSRYCLLYTSKSDIVKINSYYSVTASVDRFPNKPF